MKINKKFNYVLFVFMAIIFFIFSGFFKIYIKGNIKSNMSGSVNLVYTAPIEDVKNNNYILGYFPFGENNIRKHFSSENVIIEKLQISKLADTSFIINLNLNFTNLKELSKLDGFSDFKFSNENTESGYAINCIISNNERTKLINVLDFNLTFEDKINSSNGIIKDQEIRWYKTDFNKDIILTANLFSEKKNPSGIENNVELPNEKDEQNEDSNEKEKKCGLFGIELPIVLLFLIVPYIKKKN